MRKNIFIILLCTLSCWLVSSCSENPVPYLDSSQSTLEVQHESEVAQKHLDFVLNRRVFLPEMEHFYKEYSVEYNKQFDLSITFGDLINNTYFEDLKWEDLSNEEDYTMIAFVGTAKTRDKSTIAATFVWTETAKNPFVFFATFKGGKSETEWTVDELQEQYNCDNQTATYICDSMFSFMLSSVLHGIEDKNATLNQLMPSEVVDNNSMSTAASYNTPGYLFPSHTTYITEADLRGLTKHEVALIRNEIYARHGYVFKQEEFKVYFNTQSWYRPNENFSTSMLNKIEKANVEFIVNYEKKMDEIIRCENFEELVDLGQHPFNYDESVFVDFFDQTYENEFYWDNIGATYSTFEVDGYESFDVYKISFPNDSYGYYLVPFSGEKGTIRSVYQFIEGEQLRLIWEQ